jgi:hypothetical protein
MYDVYCSIKKIYVGLILTFFCLLLAAKLAAEELPLYQVELDEEQLILLDVTLNGGTITRSIDVYQRGDKLLIAIEPLFDALKIRYVISKDILSIWQDGVEQQFSLKSQPSQVNSNTLLWASDNFYFFTELALFERLFPAKLEFSYKSLQLKISTPEKATIFPSQKIAQQTQQRSINRISSTENEWEETQLPITIADQYRLITVPHGRVNIAAETNDTDTYINGSAQLTADLLYHSANLTLSDTNNSDLAARLVLSRYKTKPNDYILGLYDQYQLGDVSSISNGISTGSSGGLGVSLSRHPSNYRQSNQAITLEEIAPPGWEAELFRNHIFLAATTVPADGLLKFEDIEVEYGVNTYEIKLYGPFGETEVRKKSIELNSNALKQGQFSHGFYGLDRNHRLINDQSDQDYGVTDLGGTFDYGISDNWQLGVGFAALEDNKQFFNIKNALSLPGMLLENDISFDQDGNYAQITSLKGSAFESDRYSLILESADDFISARINAIGKSVGVQGSYSRPTDWVNLNFNVNYREDDYARNFLFGNRLSGSMGELQFRHNLTYYQNTLLQDVEENQSSGFIGALGVSGNLPYDFRISADIQYDPEADKPLLKSSSVLVQKNLRGPWNGFHSFTANYLPLAANGSASWRVSHRAAWQSESFQLNVSTTYDESDRWSIQLGLQFFLGYDYHNNRLLLNQNIQSNSATLDVHTYLDRQLNGIPDPLDYNLNDVEFYGNPEWEHLEDSKNGRTILPGVYGVTPFGFGAKWKDGSNTINNDYVVYTHPGAYVDVNMPFVLSTELVGFVLRSKGGREIGMQNVRIELTDGDGNVLQENDTDLDGYYEFNGLSPGQYKLRVAQSNLKEKAYTSDVVGYSVLTGGQGGYSELPAITLHSIESGEVADAEDIAVFILDAENTEPVVWDNDAKKRRNYFTLPTKDKVMAKHSLTQENAAITSDIEPADVEHKTQTIDGNSVVRQVNEAESVTTKFSGPTNNTSGGLPTLTIGSGSMRKLSVGENNTDELDTPENNFSALTSTGGDVYVIQLGSYADEINATELKNRMSNSVLLADDFTILKRLDTGTFRLIYGGFPSRNDAQMFAQQHISKGQPYFIIKNEMDQPIKQITTLAPATDSGWVIQLYASVSPVGQDDIKTEFAKVGPLYLANKETNNNTILHCLVSQSFSSKETANAALARSGLDGWINSISNYTDVSAL